MLKLILGSACLTAAALRAQELPPGGWANLRIEKPGKGAGVAWRSHDGDTVVRALTEPAGRSDWLVVTQAADHAVIDTRQAFQKGIAKVQLLLYGTEVADKRGELGVACLDIEGVKNGDIAFFYFLKDPETPSRTWVRRKYRMSGNRDKIMFLHDITDSLEDLYFRVDLLSPGVYKVYGLRFAKAEAPEPNNNHPPELLFRASFDGTPEADFAKGAATPLAAENLMYGEGVIGQAVKLTRADRSALTYQFKDNAIPDRGTVAFWYRPLWDPADAPANRNLFRFGRPPGGRIGSGTVMLWYWGMAIRGDISDIDDSYISSLRAVNKDVWRHLAVSWADDRFIIYVDGSALSQKSGENGRPVLEAAQKMNRFWFSGERVFDAFHVGGFDRSGQADGMVDDLRIYSAPLDAGDIKKIMSEGCPLKITAPRLYFTDSATNVFETVIENLTEHEQEISWEIAAVGGQAILKSAERIVIPAAGSSSHNIGLPILPKGAYALRAACGKRMPAERRFWVMPEKNPERAADGNELDLRLVDSLELGRLPPAERFVSTGQHRLGKLNGVPYLEAGQDYGNRFACRFRLPDDGGHLYCFEWDYPDDKKRTADIIVQPSTQATLNYALQVGYLTGDDVPNQHKILTARCLYWAEPDRRDVAVVVMTASDQAPAALAAIRLYRVEGGLPAARQRLPAPVDGWHRTVGIYYEDPAFSYGFAARGADLPNYAKTIDRMAAYMKYSGQTLLATCASFYDGLLGEHYMGREHADQFMNAWLTRFDADGLEYMATFNHYYMSAPEGRLTRQSLTDGSLYGSSLAIKSSGTPAPPNKQKAPLFNMLHPSVQKKLYDDFEAVLLAGQNHPSFRGFQLHLVPACIHWLGSIDSGYNDYMIDAFSRDTGISVPADRNDPLRGKVYAEWLLEHAREAWIGWRCRAVAAFYKKVAARMTSVRPDLRLAFTLFTPPLWLRPGFDDPAYIDTLNREAGIDVRLYRDTPNIIFSQAIYPADYRHEYVTRKKWTDEQTLYLRDRYKMPGIYKTLSEAANPWLHMHDRYWESAVGRQRHGAGMTLDADWLQEHPWRVSTLNPASFHAMRNYVLPLRYRDILGMTRGGFLIGTYGMEEFLTPFARAFRALPAKKFSDMPQSTDTVKYRSLDDGEKIWFYVVNTGDTSHPFRVDAAAGEITDLLTGACPAEYASGELHLVMRPYQLRSFCAVKNDAKETKQKGTE